MVVITKMSRWSGEVLALGLTWGTSAWGQSVAEQAPPATAEAVSSTHSVRAAVARLDGLASERVVRGLAEGNAQALERAMDALELGMALSPLPGLVFNAAVVAKHSGDCGAAAALFARFVAVNPESRNRGRAEREVEQLRSCARTEPGTAGLLMPGVPLPLRLGAKEAWASPAALALRTQGPGALGAELAGDRPGAERSAGATATTWGLLGSASVAGVLAGVFTLQIWHKKREFDTAKSQRDQATTDADGETYHDRAEGLKLQGERAQDRARILGGVALGLGVAGGLSLWLTASPSDRQNEQATAIGIEAAMGGAAARFRQRF